MSGRKTKLTRELINEAEDLIKMGNYVSTVCAYLNIGETTWYRWLAEGGAATRGLKREFWAAIKKAESHAEIRNVGLIQQAGKTDWKAAMTYLERKFPDRWGRKDRVTAELEHSGNVGVQIKIDYGDDDDGG